MADNRLNGVTQWHVYVLPPRDFFYDATLTIDEHLDRLEATEAELAVGDEYNGTARRERSRAFSAMAAVARHPWWESDGYGGARVVFDIATDSTCYLFKIDNNGTTFVVSATAQPWLDDQLVSLEAHRIEKAV